MTTGDPIAIEAVRQAFPLLAEYTFLNTGTMGLMARPVADRYLGLLRDFELQGWIAEPEARQQAEEARARLAALVGATPDEIALTGNATDGLAYLVAAYPWCPGDEALISDQEHPAMVFPFTYYAQWGRLTLRRFHVSRDPAETLANAQAAITPGKTRLVSFSHVTSQTGTRLPAREIAGAARAAGAHCFLDATQSFAQLAPADVSFAGLGADFATSNGHKWLGAGKGTGFLYVRQGALDLLQPAHVGAGALRRLPGTGDGAAPGDPRRLELVPSARRFEYGTCNWMLFASIPLALDWIESIGWDAVTARARQLAAELRTALRAVPGVTLLTPEAWDDSSAMTTFALQEGDAQQLAERLRHVHRIRVRTVPEMNALRISTAYYNNRQDLERLLDALHCDVVHQ